MYLKLCSHQSLTVFELGFQKHGCGAHFQLTTRCGWITVITTRYMNFQLPCPNPWAAQKITEEVRRRLKAPILCRLLGFLSLRGVLRVWWCFSACMNQVFSDSERRNGTTTGSWRTWTYATSFWRHTDNVMEEKHLHINQIERTPSF